MWLECTHACPAVGRLSPPIKISAVEITTCLHLHLICWLIEGEIHHIHFISD